MLFLFDFEFSSHISPLQYCTDHFKGFEGVAMVGIRNRFSHAKRSRVDPSKQENMIYVVTRQKQQQRPNADITSEIISAPFQKQNKVQRTSPGKIMKKEIRGRNKHELPKFTSGYQNSWWARDGG